MLSHLAALFVVRKHLHYEGKHGTLLSDDIKEEGPFATLKVDPNPLQIPSIQGP